jgi:hypothetical protein
MTDENTKKEIVSAVVETAVAGGAGALGVVMGADPVTVALVAAGGVAATKVTNAALAHFLDRVRARWADFWDVYRKGRAGDPDLAEAEVQANSDDPVLRDLVVESARAVAEALADPVIPVLARLTRAYQSEGKVADGFFRGVRRLLTDVTESEFVTLRDLISRVVALPFAPEPTAVELLYFALSPDTDVQLNVLCHVIDGGLSAGPRIAQSVREPERFRLGVFEDALRLFSLIKRNDLGTESMGRWGVPSSVNVFISMVTLRRMHAVMT